MLNPEFSMVIGGRIVVVEKVGGGTLGRKYSGTWKIEIFDYLSTGELFMVFDTDLNSYTEHTHRSAARAGAEYMAYVPEDRAMDEDPNE